MKIQVTHIQLSGWRINGFTDGLSLFVEKIQKLFFYEEILNRVRFVAMVQALLQLSLMLTFLCSALQLHAQQLYLENLPPEVKLSSNKVNCIVKDSQGFLWIGTANGLNLFDGYQVKIFKNKIGNPNSLSNNVVQDIIEDHEGMLWIATDGGLNKFNPQTGDFQHFRHNTDDPNSLNNNQVRAIYEDENYNLWVGTLEGLNKFDSATATFTQYFHPFPKMSPWDDVQDIRQIERCNIRNEVFLILAYWGSGIMKFNLKTAEFSRVKAIDGEYDFVNWPYIHVSDKKELFAVGGGEIFKYNDFQQGLNIIQIQDLDSHNSQAIYKYQNTLLLGGEYGKILQIDLEGNILMEEMIHSKDQDEAVSRIFVKTIAKGVDKEIWIGTIREGLRKLDLGKNRFRNYKHNLEKYQSNIDNNIVALVESKPETFLVGTFSNELFQFDLPQKRFSAPFRLALQKTSYPNIPIRKLMKDSKDRLLVGGAFEGGIGYLGAQTNTFKPLSEIYNINGTNINFVNSIQEINSSEIWVGTYEGILVLPIDSLLGGSYEVFSDRIEQGGLSHSDVFSILEDHKKRVWVGTQATGLNRWDKNTKQFLHFRHDIYDANSISSDNIINIFEDSKDHLWISTLNGINLWNEESQNFSHFPEFPALQEEIVQSFREDQQGNLWMARKQSLIRFNPEEKTLLQFDEKDGLFNTGFYPNAFATSSITGHFLIGGKNGITVFHPDSIRNNDFVPNVYITGLRRYEAEGEEIVEKGMNWKNDITLSYKNTILTFEFAALNYRNSKQNRYTYQLEGFNDNWIDIGTKREVTFTNLPPGEYNLNVKGSNNDGVWNEQPTSLQITISPPWWKTKIAYLLYGLLFLGVLYFIYRFLLYRQSLNYQLQTEQAEAKRLKELDSFKSRLYTNLTHEFRTPLTVILGMTQQIRNEPKQFLDTGTQLIERNGKNLLRLINQLLDLSRLEDKSFQLRLQQLDIVAYLRYLTESFQTYANGENLSLQFLSTLEQLQMDYDPEQVQQIVTNLISNAVKYTHSGGAIRVKVKQVKQQLQLEIHDTGIGIAAVDLTHIFDRFYQVDASTTRKEEGTGIGLAHTRELVQLMGGTIEVESQVGKGSVFSILLPITNNAVIEVPELAATDLVVPIAIPVNDTVASPSESPQLLIIEDNPDVVTYLKSCLSNQYQIDVAYNGKIGIEKAIEQIPDLIISDVMMPEKDGYEVCNTLKNDERTSHIPIILLTAKADSDSKIIGLRRGADAYLTKPFDKEELLVRLEMMVAKQQKIAAYFSQGSKVESIEEDIQIEHEFIQKVRSIVEKYYTNDRFALPQLCQKIGMSRSQLYRKMKALINTSPSDFIRTYRLQQAKKLLETSDLNVSEVVWEVGFTSLSHFSKIFQEEFETPPSAINK